MNADLTMTNVWLAVLAMVSIIELAGLIALVVLAIPVLRRLDALIGMLEREAAPALMRAHDVMDQMDDVAARVRRLDDDARFAADRVKRGVQTFVAAAQKTLGPALSLVRGVRQAIRPPARRQVAEHDAEDAAARFVYEGGQQPRRL